MHWTRWMAAAVIVPFAWITYRALADVGYVGIFEYELAASPGWQVLADLVIALGLVAIWMIRDARSTGRNVWPYLLLTLTLGSFGPLLYLLLSGKRAGQAQDSPALT